MPPTSTIIGPALAPKNQSAAASGARTMPANSAAVANTVADLRPGRPFVLFPVAYALSMVILLWCQVVKGTDARRLGGLTVKFCGAARKSVEQARCQQGQAAL
ncbi:MAG: hypothetical protein Kow0096_17130 [Thiohalomonadaceae bacterium]